MAAAFIAIAGNIGVGKSSFTELLARETKARPAFEAVEENPYLADFYKDMSRWGFQSQVFFLVRRVRQHQELTALTGQAIIQDRSLYEDAEVFARNLHLSGRMSDRDWRTYEDLYHAVSLALRPPELVVYLKASLPVLKSRIAKRGRDFEKALTDDYLGRLNTLYDEWAANFRRAEVLTIDTDGLDFVAKSDDLKTLISKVNSSLATPHSV